MVNNNWKNNMNLFSFFGNNFGGFLLVLCLAFVGSKSWAQTDDQQMDLTIYGVQQLEIRDADKFQSWPKYKDNVVEIPAISYSLIPNKIEATIVPPPIKPAKINVEEKIKKLYKGYARAGFGIYANTLVDLYYMDGRSRKGSYMVQAKHRGSAGGVASADSIPDSFSNNEINLWGKRFVKKHVIQGNFKWDREKRNFYGFNPAIYSDINVDEINRLTYGLGADVSVKSYYRDSAKVNYEAKVGFNNFRDNFDGQLNEIKVNLAAHRPIGDNHFFANLNVDYDKFDYINRVTKQSQTLKGAIVELVPRATTTKGNLKVNVGMNITVDGRDTNAFHFYPLAEVKYNMFDNLFVPYAGIKGGLEEKNYQILIEENPWVATDVAIRNKNLKMQLYGGIRGTITANTSFNLAFSQSGYDNFGYFVNDSIGGNSAPGSQFKMEYDRLAVTELLGEVTINESKKMGLFLKGQYFLYGLDKSKQEHAWYQPSTRFTMIGRYNIDNKIIAQIELYTVGKTKAKTLENIPDIALEDGGYYIVNQKGYFDINLLAEYRYTKRLSGFVKINNLFSSKYMRYNNYRTQRIAAMMGITYSF